MRVVFIHLVTKQIRQYEREKEQQMSIVTGTSVPDCFFLVLQLSKYIGRGVVDGDQTSVGTVHDMTARSFFLSE